MKKTARILLIVLLIVAVVAACRIKDCVDCNGDGIIDGQETRVSENATATYGVEQFHAQLTAQAGYEP